MSNVEFLSPKEMNEQRDMLYFKFKAISSQIDIDFHVGFPGNENETEKIQRQEELSF